MREKNKRLKTMKMKAVVILLLMVSTTFVSIVHAQNFNVNLNNLNDTFLSEENKVNYEESEWKYCGPAIVESKGKGLHFSFFNRVLDFASSGVKRFLLFRWWFFNKYWNPGAETIIQPLPIKLHKPIVLTGKHEVISSVLISPSMSNILFGGKISGNIIRTLLNKSNIPFLQNLIGDPIFDYNIPSFEQILKIIFQLPNIKKPFLVALFIWLIFLASRFSVFLLYLRPLKIPWYGLWKTLDFKGYSPFVLYKE